MSTAKQPNAPRLMIVGKCSVELWSLGAEERHRRAFAQAGVHDVVPTSAVVDQQVVLIRADYMISADLVSTLCSRTDVVLTTDDGLTAVAVHASGDKIERALNLLTAQSTGESSIGAGEFERLRPDELGSSYNDTLRKRAKPFVLSYETTPVSILEEKTFGAAYKGATDFATKWCWPRPARSVTRWAAAHGISPNSVTTASLVLVILTTWLFANGYFLTAIPVAWAMTFLDTVDGKLARVTMTSSAWGNIYDHGIDLIHPPFWWWAWYVGVLPIASPAIEGALLASLWIILAGYLVGRVLEGLFVLAFKIETHIWRPIDYHFRTITARRNPNLAILTLAAVAGHPDAGFVAVAIWTVISLVFHGIRLLQAAALRARGVRIVSWLNPEA